MARWEHVAAYVPGHRLHQVKPICWRKVWLSQKPFPSGIGRERVPCNTPVTAVR